MRTWCKASSSSCTATMVNNRIAGLIAANLYQLIHAKQKLKSPDVACTFTNCWPLPKNLKSPVVIPSKSDCFWRYLHGFSSLGEIIHCNCRTIICRIGILGFVLLCDCKVARKPSSYTFVHSTVLGEYHFSRCCIFKGESIIHGFHQVLGWSQKDSLSFRTLCSDSSVRHRHLSKSCGMRGKMPRLISCPSTTCKKNGDSQKIITVKSLKRANRRKKDIHFVPVEQRRPRELYWIIEDMAAIEQLDNIEEGMEIIDEKISTN